MASKLRVLQAGIGHMGRGWVKNVQNVAEFEFAGWVDVDESRMAERRTEFGLEDLPCYVSLQEALSENKADAFICVAPPEAHASLCIAAAQAGLHILCEKPMASSMDEGRAMVDAAANAGVSLMVAQNRRQSAVAYTLRRVVSEGAYGPPGQVFLTFRQQFGRDSFRDTMEHPLLVDMANHHFDLVRFVLGRDPVRAWGTSWNPRWSQFAGDSSAVVVFAYDDRLRVVYDATWSTVDVAKTSNQCDWRIECDGGVITAVDDIVCAGASGGDLAPVEMEDLRPAGTRRLIEEFRDTILGVAEAGTTGSDNLNTLAMVFGAVEAVNTGSEVSIENHQ